jgi:hypothetical protein
MNSGFKSGPDAPIAAISRSQVALALQQGRENIRVIYRGCDFDRLEPSFAPGKYFAFISRMGPQKNPLGAIQVATKADLPKPLTVFYPRLLDTLSMTTYTKRSFGSRSAVNTMVQPEGVGHTSSIGFERSGWRGDSKVAVGAVVGFPSVQAESLPGSREPRFWSAGRRGKPRPDPLSNPARIRRKRSTGRLS